jgi:hypothetical protein
MAGTVNVSQLKRSEANGQGMRKLIACAALAAGLLTASTANAADYFVASWDLDSMMVLDLTTLKRNGAIVTVWMTHRLAHPKDTWDCLTSQTQFDCDADRTRLMAVVLYDAKDMNLASDFSPGEWTPIVPESISAEAAVAVCNPKAVPIEDQADGTASEIVQRYRDWIAKGGKS